MGILIGKETRLIIQGITGKAGQFHARECLAYGTNVTAGVSPKKGGTQIEGIPVFSTVSAAKKEGGADATLIFVPAPHALNAILEAVDAGVKLIIVITEGIPVLDMIRARERAQEAGARIIGPNGPGIITAGQCKAGIMPGHIHRPGSIGVISRSGTLTYEAVWQLSHAGLGQSTCVGIGGDPVTGMDFTELLKLFAEDGATRAVLLIGEIGGSEEERAAWYIRDHFKKPVAAFIAGKTAPEGKRMGHAGAIIAGAAGTAHSKIDILRNCGIGIIEDPGSIGTRAKELLHG